MSLFIDFSQKNLPDISQTLSRTPSWNGSSISLDDERLDESARSSSFAPSDGDERVPWHSRSHSEAERELYELRMLLKSLGDAVGWAVDVLLLDEDESKEVKEGEKTMRERKAEAVQCMAYVRDVLSRGGKGEIDEERLVSGVEYQRRQRNKEERSSTLESRQSLSSKPKPLPTRIASSDTTSHAAGRPRSVPTATTPIASLTKIPVPHPSPRLTSPIPSNTFSSMANQAPQPRPQPVTTKAAGSEPKNVVQPWERTPRFSGDSPYTNESLPRFPPTSTVGHGSMSRVSPSTTNTAPPESPHADPLGVLR
jgi:TBC1 domain family member 5